MNSYTHRNPNFTESISADTTDKTDKTDKTFYKYKVFFDDFPQEIPDADLQKLGIIWDKIESFIVDDLKDGFQMRDLYSLIIAVMNGLELFFPGVSGLQLKKYAVYLVKRLVAELSDRNAILPEIAIMLNFIPIGTIIDMVSNLIKTPPLVNKVSFSEREEAFENDDFVKRNWIFETQK